MPRYMQAVETRFALQPRVRKGQRMRKFASVLMLCAAAMCFTGCAWRNTGPCYGIGCPAFATSASAPAKNTASVNDPASKSQRNKKAQAQNTPATNAKPAQPQANSGQ
jgi:endonuclease/exonuclease/phosphatase (EEP) superfamily protein YafD